MAEKEFKVKTGAQEAVLKVLKTLNYEFVKSLGEGRIGTVIEVKSPHVQQTIAVKIVIEEVLKANELKIWPHLSHPNILNLISYNFINAARAYIFLMEKCVASLEERLGDPGFIFDRKAFETSKYYVKGVLEGVAYLHEKNYAHMDLKLNNVLIDQEGKAVIADFDGITSTEKLTSSYGSPIPYRPPEAFCSEDGNWGLVDAKKYDCWTLGMLCIRVFTRENFNMEQYLCSNFWEKNIYPKLFDILQKDRFFIKMKTCFPRSSFGFNEVNEVLNLIMSFLVLDPTRRISSKDALKHKLFGGQEFFQMEEESPWKRKMEPRKLRENIEAMNDVEIKFVAKEELCEAVNECENKHRVTTEKVVNEKKDEKEERFAKNDSISKNNDDTMKKKVNPPALTSGIVLSAVKLLNKKENYEHEGIYLREMSTVKEKRTQNIFAWAKEKKNSLMKRLTHSRKR